MKIVVAAVGRPSRMLGPAIVEYETRAARYWSLETARLVVRCARTRHESRGLHHLVDVPYRDSERFLRDTILAAAGGPRG